MDPAAIKLPLLRVKRVKQLMRQTPMELKDGRVRTPDGRTWNWMTQTVTRREIVVPPVRDQGEM